MLTPEYMAGVADAAEEVADKLHNDVMSRIIDRLMKRTDRGEEFYLTGTDKWNIETLQQAGFLYEDVLEEIEKHSGQSSSAVADAFRDAGVRTLRNDQKIYDKMGIQAIDPLRSPQYMAILETDFQATNGTLKNLTRTTADSAQQTFIEQCDEIYTAVTRGTDTLGHALFDAVEKISDASGLWVTYPSGARTSVEAAVVRCVRTGVAQMAGRVSEKRAEEVGCDHYLVSSHLGARPSHAVWQGQVFKIHGSDKKYKNFYETTGYGTGPGLCGWNCRHSFSPFFPEFMENNMKQYSVEENAEAYEKRQKEMAELRKARELARKIAAYKKAMELTDNPELKQQLEEAIEDVEAERPNVGLAAKIGGNDIPYHEEPIILAEGVKDVESILKDFEESAINRDIETALVCTKDGKVYMCFGTKNRVFPDYDLGEELYGATVSHNHPISETEFSFSKEDIELFEKYNLKILRGCDGKYTYELSRDQLDVDEAPDDWRTEENYMHSYVILAAIEKGFGYRRWVR